MKSYRLRHIGLALLLSCCIFNTPGGAQETPAAASRPLVCDNGTFALRWDILTEGPLTAHAGKTAVGFALPNAFKEKVRPCLPEELGRWFEISDFKVGGMTLDIRIEGNGSEVAEFQVDGKKMEKPSLARDGQHHKVVLGLK